VSARMNEPYVKVFTEERDRTVNLLIDMSASGSFGTFTQSKREIAAELAALLAFSAIQNNDRVGLIIFTDEVERFVPPKKGKKHVLRVISEILTFQPRSRRTNLAAGLDYLGKLNRRKSVAFVISDFLASGWEEAIRVAGRRHDVIPVILSDPMEEAMPPLGMVVFQDMESGELVEFDTSGPEARHFARYAAQLRGARETSLRRLSLDYVHVRTDQPYVDALVRFFHQRARRLMHA
jgi:uncharacterized protein (DUF58 family)